MQYVLRYVIEYNMIFPFQFMHFVPSRKIKSLDSLKIMKTFKQRATVVMQAAP